MTKTEQGATFSTSNLKNGTLPPLEEKQLKAAMNRPVCFREAVFSQACAAGDCTTPPKDSSRDSWTVLGQVKSTRTQRIVARRFRACAAIDSTFVNKPTGPPRVLFAMRTGYRGLLHRAYLMGELITWLKVSAPGATLMVSEVTKTGRSLPESVAVTAHTDIIIGAYGGGLSYCFVMPEVSSQMVNIAVATATRPQGTGTDLAPEDDFGGMMFVLGGHENYVQADHRGGFRLPSYETELTINLFKRAVDSVLCFFFAATQRTKQSPPGKTNNGGRGGGNGSGPEAE